MKVWVINDEPKTIPRISGHKPPPGDSFSTRKLFARILIYTFVASGACILWWIMTFPVEEGTPRMELPSLLQKDVRNGVPTNDGSGDRQVKITVGQNLPPAIELIKIIPMRPLFISKAGSAPTSTISPVPNWTKPRTPSSAPI